MSKFVGGCVVLFVLAVGCIFITQAQDLAALFAAFRSEPLLQKLAWFLIVLIPLALIPSALWLADAVIRQSRAAAALELRLGGVRQGVQDLAKAQVDAESAVRHLVSSDPEDAIGAVTQRLAEAERVTHIQQSRNEIGDLQTRVEALRAQQQSLRERLTPVLEKRRSIEQLFGDLDSRENDIDRALAEVASSDDATAIEVRLKNLMEFVRQGHQRCDDIESAAKTAAALKQDYTELGARIAPYAAVEDGVARRVKELSDIRDRLASELDSLRETPQGDLASRVQAFADDKKKLDGGLADLEMQFSKLATLRRDVEGLSGNFDRALGLLSVSASTGNVDAGVEELSQFVKSTQSRLDEIERTMLTFDQLKTRLSEQQSRLVPLESKNGGVVDLLGQVQDIRDRLVAKIALLETDEHGDLASRVSTFAATKEDLEKRVATVTEQFSKLATIRSDISGLFDKLSNVADTSSN
jgi:DNA repair exonuclease SbcCD ATPase subunit